jgi:ethanolamine ammonia-lyase small subunit
MMKNEFVSDISMLDLSTRVTVDNPVDRETCENLKKKTIARICVGRAGTRYKTETMLRLRADHAVAIDAVWSHVDESIIDEMGFLKVQTLVHDKEEYLKRPDLGRLLSPETLQSIKSNCKQNPDVQIVVADGLSAPAINENIRDIYPVLVEGLTAKGYSVGTPIFVRYSRVATMDKISEALHAKVTILLVGERPGLAVGDSMGCYMAYEASAVKPESQRTVVSNIHKKGTPPVEAGAHIVSITDIMMKKKISGVQLKLEHSIYVLSNFSNKELEQRQGQGTA